MEPQSLFSRWARLPTPADASHRPSKRCGHTFTAVSGDGSRRLILFGGATALESSGGAGGGGASGIRLAGATSEVHSFDVKSGTWTRLNPTGEAPSPRAAHAAAAVGSMVVVQGGIGPAGLATDDLYVLDLAGTPRWHRVVVQGPGPGARYAHVLALVGQRFLLVLGGNDGYKPLADAWALDTAVKPYRWQLVEASGDGPGARMYAAAAARADGLLLVCGGRDASNMPLADVYGLARHRDGRWEWAAAPGVAPTPRYQHSAACIGARLHVSGGALGGGKMVDERHTVVVLDTAAGAWTLSVPMSDASGSFASQRCRHAVAAVGSCLFLYGGLSGGSLLDDLLVAEDARADEGLVGDTVEPLATIADLSSPAWAAWLAEADSRAAASPPVRAPGAAPAGAAPGLGVPSSLTEASAAEAAAAAAIAARQRDAFSMRVVSPPPTGDRGAGAAAFRELGGAGGGGGGGADGGAEADTPSDVRLHYRAAVVAAGDEGSGLVGLVRQLSIDQFENENRRISFGPGQGGDGGGAGVPGSAGGSLRRGAVTPVRGAPTGGPGGGGVHKLVIEQLLRPREWRAPADRSFLLDIAGVEELCARAEECLRQDPTVLHLAAPVKIFGDLHGQFGDLMRLFAEYGSPSPAGDIPYIDYLFLGDYVDRGAHSLETICLLLALKIEHPRNVHLLRGNHEASDINSLFGFRMECVERLGEKGGLEAWERFNALFNWMSLAAIIEKRVICMHGGIGRSIERVEQLEVLARPLTMEGGGMVLMDLLWSDPTENDGITGLQPNARGPGLVTFGPDRVKAFCDANGLQVIIRAHECVMDGFERFAQGQLITLFSATNYCGTANNAGAILVLGRDLTLYPKLIHPLPPQAAMDGVEGAGFGDGDGDAMGGAKGNETWIQSVNRDRPPTPPRGRPANGRPGLEF